MTAATKRLVSYPIYTIGDLSSGIYGIGPAILLMFYMTNILGIPIALATFAATLPKILDLLFGPIIGSLSDRTSTKLGRRRPYLLAAGILVFPLFLSVWTAPFTDPTLSAWFIAFAFGACAFCFNAYLVPFAALNSEIAPDYTDNSVLNSYRAFYSMIGCLLAGAGAPMLVDHFGGGRSGYAGMGVTLAGIMSLSILITFFVSKEPPIKKAVAKTSLRQMFQVLCSNKPLLLLGSTYGLHMVAGGASSAALAYFVTYVLEKDVTVLATLFFITFGSSIVAIPLFLAIGKRIGKHALFTLAFAIAAVAPTAYYFVDASTNLTLVYGIAVSAGMVEGAVQGFAYSMLSDCLRHGDDRHSAMLSGIFIANEKLTIALGAMCAGIILAITGLVETQVGAVAQPDSAIQGIHLIVAFLPAALNVVAIAIFMLYRPFDNMVANDHAAVTATAVQV